MNLCSHLGQVIVPNNIFSTLAKASLYCPNFAFKGSLLSLNSNLREVVSSLFNLI